MGALLAGGVTGAVTETVGSVAGVVVTVGSGTDVTTGTCVVSAVVATDTGSESPLHATSATEAIRATKMSRGRELIRTT